MQREKERGHFITFYLCHDDEMRHIGCVRSTGAWRAVGRLRFIGDFLSSRRGNMTRAVITLGCGLYPSCRFRSSFLGVFFKFFSVFEAFTAIQLHR